MSKANTVEVWCDKEFEREYPGMREQIDKIPPMIRCIASCFGQDMYGQIPKVRGLLNGSTPLSDSETRAILDVVQGQWHIQPLEAGQSNTLEYQNAFVEGNKIVISGGVHNHRQSVGDARHVTTAVANKTQVQFFNFFRAPDGRLYCDKEGSILENHSGTEMTFNNSIGLRLKFLRDSVDPQLKMSSNASGPPPSYNAGILGDLEKLGNLRDQGVLTNAEFEEQKKKFLAAMSG